MKNNNNINKNKNHSGDKAFEVASLASPTGLSWPVLGVRVAENMPYIEAEVQYVICSFHICIFLLSNFVSYGWLFLF